MMIDYILKNINDIINNLQHMTINKINITTLTKKENIITIKILMVAIMPESLKHTKTSTILDKIANTKQLLKKNLFLNK
jgi:hypothetical protein